MVQLAFDKAVDAGAIALPAESTARTPVPVMVDAPPPSTLPCTLPVMLPSTSNVTTPPMAITANFDVASGAFQTPARS